LKGMGRSWVKLPVGCRTASAGAKSRAYIDNRNIFAFNKD
jgi:hypothetical protein